MNTLEDRVRRTLREPPTPAIDGLADRVLTGIAVQRRRRRIGGLACAVLVASVVVATAIWVAGDARRVSTVPASGGSHSPASPAPTVTTPDSVPAYLEAQDEWVACLRGHGVRVTGPDENHNVSVNPDPALEAQRNACLHLLPALSDDVEMQLQSQARPTKGDWPREPVLPFPTAR